MRPVRAALWALLSGVALAALSPARAAEFGFPLTIAPALSSTFGETRTAGFHAGIDLKTWGKTGYEVRALGRGYVWRLRTSPWGYGRVVYHKLEDGRVLVYAHLERFAPRLARPVEQAQREQQHYSVDLWFEEDDIPLEAGEVIAWTGQSGAGPPHLHLELRDQDNVPINPLTNGFEVEDEVAPTLRRLALIPVGVESLVDGGREPVSVGLAWNPQRRRYESAAVVPVYGRIGVSALVYDRTDAASNKLAPYRNILLVDGRPVFSAVYDGVSYEQKHQVLLDRERLAFDGGRGNFFNLFRRQGNTLGFYQDFVQSDGLLHCGLGSGPAFLAKGRHELVVEAEDVAGNTRSAHLRVQVNAPPSMHAVRLVEDAGRLFAEVVVEDADDDQLEVDLARSPDGAEWTTASAREVTGRAGVTRWPLDPPTGLWRLRARDGAGGECLRVGAVAGPGDRGAVPELSIEARGHPDFVELILRTDQVLAGAPRVVVDDGGQRYVLVPRQLGRKVYDLALPLRADGDPLLTAAVQVRSPGGMRRWQAVRLRQEAVDPGAGARLIFEGGDAELTFPPGSAYQVFFPQASPFQPEAGEGLAPAGPGYRLEPDKASFDREVGLALRYDKHIADPQKLGIYSMRDDGGWQFAGNELAAERHMVRAQIRRFARYALLLDEEPPRITDLRPARGTRVRSRRPRLVARIGDRGAGIGREEDVVMLLDGQRLISEYDPEADTVTGLAEAELAPGPHRLVVEVRDMSGNQAREQADFQVE